MKALFWRTRLYNEDTKQWETMWYVHPIVVILSCIVTAIGTATLWVCIFNQVV